MSDSAVETIVRTVCAFFAPVNRATGSPTLFDPARTFDVEAPPAPWMAAGEVRGFTRAAGTRTGVLASGWKGAATGQYRAALDARVSFEFCTWGKLQMAIAGGSQHMNVLDETSDAEIAPSGGTAENPVAVLGGSSATELVVGDGAVEGFNVGDMVAVDADYVQQQGYVGSPIAVAFVKDAEDVKHDRDYLRRVTFNVATVLEKTSTSLLLNHALACGDPPVGSSVQKVVAFADREGGSFFQEWSAVFVMEAEGGGRVCFYYPRLQATGAASERQIQVDELGLHRLHAEMIALPVKDEVDGEQVVCWRSWMPS